jgi:hypothetical protein
LRARATIIRIELSDRIDAVLEGEKVSLQEEAEGAFEGYMGSAYDAHRAFVEGYKTACEARDRVSICPDRGGLHSTDGIISSPLRLDSLLGSQK